MTDIFSHRKRSEIMSAVRSSGNKSTEIALIALFRKNFMRGWRRNYKLTGHPDFVFLKNKLAVFADGCFWHGHNCRNVKPSSNRSYWQNKINVNKKRDRRINTILRKKGWKVIRVWECEIKLGNTRKILIIKNLIQ